MKEWKNAEDSVKNEIKDKYMLKLKLHGYNTTDIRNTNTDKELRSKIKEEIGAPCSFRTIDSATSLSGDVSRITYLKIAKWLTIDLDTSRFPLSLS